MAHWLVGDCNLLGLPAQNWMVLLGGGFALYVALLALAARRRRE
jgi:hypothetical protein